MLGQSAGLKTCCLQVWDFLTGKLKKDLQYQAEDRFLMHNSAVIALAISRDSEMVASGSQDGKVKVLASLLQSRKAPMSGCRNKHFQGLTPGGKWLLYCRVADVAEALVGPKLLASLAVCSSSRLHGNEYSLSCKARLPCIS